MAERTKKKGKHPERVLSAVKVRAIREPGRYTDGNGLYLVVDPSGAKRWLLRTKVSKKRCDLGLGGVSLVSLAEAREEAIRLRKIARAGGDPLAERRQQKAARERDAETPTFEKAAREVHKSHSKAFRNEKHQKQWITTLETYVFPVFGPVRVDHISANHVIDALLPIWIPKPETARRVKQRIKTVFDWAKAKGYRSGDNPTEGITNVLPMHNRRQEHHPAMPYAQVPAFIQQIRKHEGVSARLAFEFLILNAARTGEVLLARWSEIDFSTKTWTIPASRMKAKAEHRVPLSVRSIEILESALTIADGGEYVFPGGLPKHPLSNMVFEMCIRRMKLQTHITPHGFRSSFRDWAEEKTSFPNAVVEAALAHTVKSKVEAAYLRTTLFEKRRKLMKSWTVFATSTLGPQS